MINALAGQIRGKDYANEMMAERVINYALLDGTAGRLAE